MRNEKPASGAATGLVVFTFGIFSGLFFAVVTWTPDSTEPRLIALERSIVVDDRLTALEKYLESGALPQQSPKTTPVEKTGRMGRLLASLSLEGEAYRLKLVHIPEVPPFFMVDPSSTLVDNMLPYLQTAEQHLMQAFKRVLLRDPCYQGNPSTKYPPCFAQSRLYQNIGERAVVLDVGSNSGFYSLFSASMGYRVIGVDPQVHCAQFVRAAVTASGLDSRITFHNAFAGTADQPRDVMPRTGCWGTFPYVTDAQTADTNSLYDTPKAKIPVKVPTIAVDDLVTPSHDVVVVMKVDVEGHEKHVFEGARRMLEAKKILNMFVEWNKSQWEAEGVQYSTVIETAKWLMSLGYLFKVSNYGDYEDQEPFLDEERLPSFFEEGWNSIDVHIYLPEQ